MMLPRPRVRGAGRGGPRPAHPAPPGSPILSAVCSERPCPRRPRGGMVGAKPAATLPSGEHALDTPFNVAIASPGQRAGWEDSGVAPLLARRAQLQVGRGRRGSPPRQSCRRVESRRILLRGQVRKSTGSWTSEAGALQFERRSSGRGAGEKPLPGAQVWRSRSINASNVPRRATSRSRCSRRRRSAPRRSRRWTGRSADRARSCRLRRPRCCEPAGPSWDSARAPGQSR